MFTEETRCKCFLIQNCHLIFVATFSILTNWCQCDRVQRKLGNQREQSVQKAMKKFGRNQQILGCIRAEKIPGEFSF